MCRCPERMTGNAFVQCSPSEVVNTQPCQPSPCGPNSQCREINGQAVCSCLVGFIGSPPSCRPECTVSTDCLPNEACSNRKCINPCQGSCGVAAKCQVINHNPICSCPASYTGNPFVRCAIQEFNPEPVNPCTPSPCGPYSICKEISNSPSCSCQSGFIGSPPYCKPECISNSECPLHLACINQKCADPCSGSCGSNTDCHVISHSPSCSCMSDFTGNPFIECHRMQITQDIATPCQPSPCGANAVCKEFNGAGSCTCLPEYFGNPYEGCRPECIINTDCPSNKACVQTKCQDPCPGACAPNAFCQVVNHAPSCSCERGYTGDPFRYCIPEQTAQTPIDVCQPSPCGPNSRCQEVNSQAVCSCLPNYIGSPPGCHPECVTSAECPREKACMNQKCEDPCINACGINTECRVINHSPICQCQLRYTGDPFTRCNPIPPPVANAVLEPYRNPCVPSPCGPNAICQERGNVPSCSCMSNYMGSPPNCKPECTINSECPTSQACIQQKCRDPCQGSCGIAAICTVSRHTPICTCPEGYAGDAFTMCTPKPHEADVIIDKCNPSPCGTNAICRDGECSCIEEHQGDPYVGCRPECVLSTDCPRDKACVRNKCVNPCQGTCSANAICEVINHVPMCSCPQGMTGNAFYNCEPIRVPIVTNPCLPSPCGPNSQCREINGQAVCTCIPNYKGSPPLCRPECAVSSDCAPNRACSNQRCIDPCVGSCGVEAKCTVVKHNPICTCPLKYTGDPFIRCTPYRPPVADVTPCNPSPCGSNSICKEVSGTPSCTCMDNFFGTPPYCRPECTSNSECPTNQACVNQKCKDPCVNACGFNSQCRTISHSPMCFCDSGFTGDPFSNCYPQQDLIPERATPCEPSPCGPNAECKEYNNAGSCTCLPEYIGNPYEGCRPECSVNTDCIPSKACIRNKCQDPCPGTCGPMALCSVVNHLPSCSCPPGYTGDPYIRCGVFNEPLQETVTPCQPNPCGPNSICRPVNSQSVCSCMPNYIGSPPGCRPECTVSSECSTDKACVNQKCGDPCPNHCGLNTNCRVINHSPICTCSQGFIGDPFTRCYPQPLVTHEPELTKNPCQPSPCGPNALCRDINGSPSCSCMPTFQGLPPNCRPECAINQDCPSNKACITMKCRDPCPGSCGQNAVCTVFNHLPSCACSQGFTGDPFTSCILLQPIEDERPTDPCNPSPCGFNAQCRDGICTCLNEYHGDPYFGCKPECVTNMDCPLDKVCSGNKCMNPCPGTCAPTAQCNVYNHIPICTCPEGTSGNAFVECHAVQLVEVNEPCRPNLCGPNSQCRAVNNQAVCSCLPTFIGSPPSCRPECTISAECPLNEACNNHKCINPCLGTCGYGTRCEVVNHNPICSCPAQYTGDPFTHCNPIVSAPLPPVDPCTPSPCGPYSVCKVIGESPSCTCQSDYTGAPPNCRPECVSNSECPSNLACVNQKCRDPCPGSCGYNADCKVISHALVCSCPFGQTGDPLAACSAIKDTIIEYSSPCDPSPCGINAECKERNSAGSCRCMESYVGNPYEGCRPECVINSDCAPMLACIQNKCRDPCPGICAPNGVCQVVNHLPSCYCPPGLTGNAYVNCIEKIEDVVKPTPCTPSPCGPNSLCRELNSQAVCSCQQDFMGTPPNCRPECTINSECPSEKACLNRKCVDPCIGQCGRNANCRVFAHNPICSCKDRFTGDPFTNCFPMAVSIPTLAQEVNPCVPSPCGPNSQCQNFNGNARCSCLPNYISSPPHCRPECTINSECNAIMACISNRCTNPCPGACGNNAQCNVNNHLPICSCLPGFTGDPFSSCQIKQQDLEPINPCSPSPCGANAACQDGLCTCLPEYQGDPYYACKPECVLNSDCPRDRACINNKCGNPCIGTCGTDAICETINHIPMCSCPPGYSGSPFHYCTKVLDVTYVNLCEPSPCGPNSQCKEVNGHAVCVCVQSYIGSPPNCRPECTVSSDCKLNQACSNQKCIDPCPGACGRNTHCIVVNHNPVCSCLNGYSGDPFSYCEFIPATPPVKVNPCLPSPCGPNSQCSENGESADCRCLSEYIGTPPNCRPECTSNTECATSMACMNRKCRDPCPGSCGLNAECRVVSHTPICICQRGYTGDPFLQCTIEVAAIEQERPTPCVPSPCGANALCREQNNAGSCSCLPGYFGNPYEACKPECLVNSDCPSNLACYQNKCHDPCPGTCGINAICNVINHVPSCSCLEQYYGDPYKICSFKPQSEITDPCNPSPCGPNSQCKSLNGLAICTCLPEYQGSPPMCRPECITSSECSLDKVCENFKCVSPCPRACGVNTDCRVIKHNPICSCKHGYTGDPFSICYVVVEREPVVQEPIDPCAPSPCGLNAVCRNVGGIPSCSCNVGYFGSPPNCKPECVLNTDCSNDKACINMKCQNPCLGSCGVNAMCNVITHIPVCSCPIGYEGDPFAYCNIKPIEPPQKLDPCHPSPCGPNAQCNNGECTCLPEYQGDPYFGCRPECVLSTDCPLDKACLRSKCVDPCVNMCGASAECNVYNHVAICSCPTGMSGDAFTQCLRIEKPVSRPCEPSPCGPNSICREANGQSVCACVEGFIGNPPNCRPECIQSTDCAPFQACINRKCQDPCPGSCGTNAICNVVKHNPICSCPARYTGSPFNHCYVQVIEEPLANPCVPNPCGPNSICNLSPDGKSQTCSCQPTFEGSPPQCRRECTASDECPSDKACINYKCKDPCPGSCGINTQCVVRLHSPMCSCTIGYTGDAFTSCHSTPQPEPTDPCNPTPCGPNARCKVSRNGAAACICEEGYFGNPYESCRPECVINTDCPYNKACLRNKCEDPCPGVCGTTATCQVINHVPSCSCAPGYTGNPYAYCHIIINEPPPASKDPCIPSPCGSNAVCKNNNGYASCSCSPDFFGSPPNCRPECTSNSECDATKSCVRQKCVNPCIGGACGQNAECRVVNHAPICSCRRGFEGDPFIRCAVIGKLPPREINPCIPSPCGPNALCQMQNTVPICTCMENYMGSAPNCRPECTVNSDCLSNMACVNQKCRDPCQGSCGLQTECQVYQHAAICSCKEGYTGNPFESCYIREHIETMPTVYDKCQPSPCGANADCNDGVCTCRLNYFGNPYMSCRPECTLNSDCAPHLTCVNNKCINPCNNLCGQGALCEVYNHIPMCSCPSNTTGNAFFSCTPVLAILERRNPCEPSPCGPYSICRTMNEQAVCSCLMGYVGVPPSCRPECLVDSDCTRLLSCSNQKCRDPCQGSCGLGAECRVHNHKPICYCRNGYTGDPFTQCVIIHNEHPPRTNPCEPSPCGPNAVCRVVGEAPSCSCMPTFSGSAPYCRPECVTNSECSFDKACINNNCADPCVGACGRNAECRVISHSPMCVCQTGFEGDSFDQCLPIQVPAPRPTMRPCEPNPCGSNANCQERDGIGSCTCTSGYFGNPYEGCRPECVLNSDCPDNRACINNKCQDPCPGFCGTNAQCQTVNHIPKCTCVFGYVGNPYDNCIYREETPIDPCNQSPCGPYSTCNAVNNKAMCTCTQGHVGSPPNCRPECLTSPECSLDKACVRQKCVDPCVGTCGENAQCRVHHHSPYCTCLAGFEGDPFLRCTKEKPYIPTVTNPCEPSPCGPFSTCRDVGSSAICSCKAGYIGAPPYCAPECTINEDCPNDQACVREKCVDPCLGSCGANADCRAMNHVAICTCRLGYKGNSFEGCYVYDEPGIPVPEDPCALSPCGINALCNNGICSCIAGYHGNPTVECRPECTGDNDCQKQMACVHYKCVNPCKNTCGLNAICNVYNHIAICECPATLQGDAFIACRPVIAPTVSDPCTPNPCGANSICRAVGTVAHCSCRPPLMSEPRACRAECRANPDCAPHLACRNGKCRDPCPGACGAHALCRTVMHSPICTCPNNYVGDPFVRCLPALESDPPIRSPCPDCGPNADCLDGSCRCRTGYFGVPPFCRYECLGSNDCDRHLTCINRRCVDPCPGACGQGAQCSPVAHEPRCECPPSTTGNPLILCRAIQNIPPTPNDPCNPSPCGPGALCRARGTGASCECEPGLRGDPYSGCRPECLADSDCSPSRACMRSHCRDPCQGTCGVGADCETVNHIPLCSCPPGTRGNAFERCEVIRSPPPCDPSPCGPGALCSASGGGAVCSCPAGTSGDARTSGCRPECVVSSECSRDRACVHNKCVDPCVGVCGNNAECRVFDHAPICSCPPDTTGNPFHDCIPRARESTPPNPCDPNPCGPHGTCRDGFCTYPECIVNDDCPGDRACLNRKCTDPCVNACGLNAICTGVRHSAVCSCPAGYTGSPFVRCERIVVSTPAPPVPECVRDNQCADDAACVDSRCSPVCGPANCGLNARCLARQHRARCTCMPGYEGDAYRGCYSVQCHSNNDCPDDESCEGGSCSKVCSRVRCGTDARCTARGHTASCECSPGAHGNPWTACRRDECAADDDCAAWLACRAGTCSDPCPGACAQGALCTVVRHAPACECSRGTQGNPKIECREVQYNNNECETDADCGPELACLQGSCRNPCEPTSCGTGAICRVANTLPFRTMICECPKPLVGDASLLCKPRGECSGDSECSDEETCVSRRCVPACADACGVGAECRAARHRPQCTCVAPLQGNPNVACTPVSMSEPECISDSECGAAEACVNRRCASACAAACGAGALCEASAHRARCRCPPGTAGDPATFCYTTECTSDDNCPFHKSCVNGYCQDPCQSGTPCGRDATCETVAHVATCRCPPGTQGDARRACISAVCHYNEDCDDTQVCNRLNRVCQPACSESACAPGALCTGRGHRAQCTCPAGSAGDAYGRGCSTQPTPSVQCTSDSECPAPLACVNAHCVDLCVGAPCEAGLVCNTVDVLPLRAVACVCPDGGRAAPDVGCRAPPRGECATDAECALSQTCRRGSCVEACRADPCGQNALCESIDHSSQCTCPTGYTGNPRIECNSVPRNPMIWECYSDEECGPERACMERECVNPCNDACGAGALCRVIDHKPQCSCPRGYSGVATLRCIPPSSGSVIPVGCKANPECPLSQACVNGACADPCVCGTNAECTVVRHHPVCFCERGYSGNPYIGCTKVGCTSDSECPDSDTCYNGACVNPCVVDAPCAISAECYGRAHRPNCRCPAGTMGDPFSKCQPAECEIDNDCNDDSVCIKGLCRNACSLEGRNPCAANAECFARNHAASCKCPPALRLGDPLVQCQRIAVIGDPECRFDSECPSGHACLKEECREACNELKPCIGNARCSVSDSVPFRTLICRCPDGFIQEEGGSCKPAQLPPLSCSSDQDCSDKESCVNRICRNPCNCGDNAECFVKDHRPVCSCREGYDGDPYRVCRVVGCRTDSECESFEACVNGNCISPCLLNSTCGPNAECYVERNQPLCRCRPGFEGDAFTGCNAVECRSNGDCPQDKQCRAHRCINPCLGSNICGQRATCLVRNHIAVCKCDSGYSGSPYVECKPIVIAECYVDADCPPKSACLSSRCVNPCTELRPCASPASCEVSPTLPVRTMLCTCPPGYVSSGGGICRPATPLFDVVCETDNNCTANHACITSVCKNPCECGPNTDCQIKDHKPVCACRPGFIGDARTGCYEILCRSDSQCSDDETCINNRCVPACSIEADICGESAECYGVDHRASCRCRIGTIGNPSIACTPVGCRADSDCPNDKSCINTKCESPCTPTTCKEPADCREHLHEAHCVCPPGYRSTNTGCEELRVPQCASDVDCPSGTACLNAKCVNPCLNPSPCGPNAECKVIDTLPVRTMICECKPGYRGNALVECTTNKQPTAKCVDGQGLDENGECAPCRQSEGRTVDVRGRCVCDARRGYTERGAECAPGGCSADGDCDDRSRCLGGVCVDACKADPCGIRTTCEAYGHRSHCTCISGYTGNPREQCSGLRTDFPIPETEVRCKADGVSVVLTIKNFTGVVYVKSYSKDERCRLAVATSRDEESKVDFTVHFGDCGLVHVDGLASFVLVMQNHPKLVTSNAKAFHIKCIYQTGEQNVTLAFNVSMLTTAGTIANTGPPPTCSMRIVSRTGDEVSSAEIGENLVLQVDVQPSSIYGGFARSCIAKTSEASTNVENEYRVTDADGCATDTAIFGEWERSEDGSALRASFNAFKFPSSDNIRFQCNIRVCFGKCQPVNCHGADAFGKRRKREAISSSNEQTFGNEGQLREEVTVESNQILTLQRRDASQVARQRDGWSEGGAGAAGSGAGEVCVSAAGLAVALALTALLALVAVAAAVACWLVAWRRARPPPAPLPHPPDFPNPLFQR